MGPSSHFLSHTHCSQQRTLTPSRDGTTQSRQTRWEVLVDIHCKQRDSYENQSIIHVPVRLQRSPPSPYLAPMIQARIRVAREQHQ